MQLDAYKLQEEIAREMQNLTNQQGQQLNQAEKATRNADVEVMIGNEEQKKASKYKCGSRWCTLIIILVVLAILAVIGLIIGLAVGLRKK